MFWETVRKMYYSDFSYHSDNLLQLSVFPFSCFSFLVMYPCYIRSVHSNKQFLYCSYKECLQTSYNCYFIISGNLQDLLFADTLKFHYSLRTAFFHREELLSNSNSGAKHPYLELLLVVLRFWQSKVKHNCSETYWNRNGGVRISKCKHSNIQYTCDKMFFCISEKKKRDWT